MSERTITVICPVCPVPDLRLDADQVTFFVDLAGNAAHEFVCPICRVLRQRVWQDSDMPARRAALFFEEAVGIRVHRVAHLGKTVEAALADFGETFTGEPLLTSDGMRAELDRYSAAERRLQA